MQLALPPDFMTKLREFSSSAETPSVRAGAPIHCIVGCGAQNSHIPLRRPQFGSNAEWMPNIVFSALNRISLGEKRVSWNCYQGSAQGKDYRIVCKPFPEPRLRRTMASGMGIGIASQTKGKRAPSSGTTPARSTRRTALRLKASRSGLAAPAPARGG